MKKIVLSVKVIGSFIILILFTNCSKTPEACFTYDKGSTDIKVNEEVHFSASCSKNADTYEWNFGDGSASSTASGSDVKHKYTTAGTYTVKLAAKNNKKTTETSQSLLVKQ